MPQSAAIQIADKLHNVIEQTVRVGRIAPGFVIHSRTATIEISHGESAGGELTGGVTIPAGMALDAVQSDHQSARRRGRGPIAPAMHVAVRGDEGFRHRQWWKPGRRHDHFRIQLNASDSVPASDASTLANRSCVGLSNNTMRIHSRDSSCGTASMIVSSIALAASSMG